MSGLYAVADDDAPDLCALAPLLAGQLVYGGETNNRFADPPGALIGAVGRDGFGQGPMPRWLAQYGLWAALDGELHDCAALEPLRKAHGGDAEIFAALYRSGGLESTLPGLNGAFFVVLFDPATRTLVCANDRYGLYPMYWAEQGGRFCVAARVACSVLAGAADGAWDASGAAMLLTLDDYAGETTLVEGVSAFPQATVLTRSGGKNIWRRYWRYDFTPRVTENQFAETAEAIGARFVDAVKRQCKTGRSIGVTLSGGLDSRLIVAAAAKAGIAVDTFTWGKDGCYDRRFAADVSRTYGMRHHDCAYSYDEFPKRFEATSRLAEGLIDFFDCHMAAHLQHLDGACDVVLNGYAGDVILGGSFLRPAWMTNQPVDRLAAAIFAWRNTLLKEDGLDAAIPGARDRIPGDAMPSARFLALMEPLADLPAPDCVDRFILENRQRRVTAMGTVLMRAVTESAACFFDYDLLDLEQSVPAAMRFEHRIYKEVMKRAFPETLDIRWQRTLLPAGYPEWMSTPSKAFLKGCRILEGKIGWPRIASRQSPVAFGPWLRGPLRDWIEPLCRDPHPVTDEILAPAFRERVWNDHANGIDRSRYLGVVAALRGFGGVLEAARAKRPATACTPVRVTADG